MIHALFLCSCFFFCLYLVSCILGKYIAWVFDDQRPLESIGMASRADQVKKLLEDFFQKVFSRISIVDMTWRQYALSILIFHIVLFVGLYSLLRLSSFFIAEQPVISPPEAFNIAISFITNTNWQGYVPEEKMTGALVRYGIIPQMFLTPAISISVAWCFMRGLIHKDDQGRVGNFYLDMFRSTCFLLLPLALFSGAILAIGGVPQSSSNNANCIAFQNPRDFQAPIAAYTAIETLGSNGGGYFNSNCSHPLQNPTPWTHVFEIGLMLLIPASLLMAFGQYAGLQTFSNRIFLMFVSVFVIMLSLSIFSERLGTLYSGGSEASYLFVNMEGKECRIGSFWSLFWMIATTATSTGATALSLSSCMPLTMVIPLGLMQIGEVIFGGAGVGFLSLMLFSLLSVFTSGLMVGRTPEIFYKKITSKDMLLVLFILTVPLSLTLIPLGYISWNTTYLFSLSSTPMRSLTEVLYALASCANNNGSGITTIQTENVYFTLLLGCIMWLGRLLPLLGYLALAGNFVRKNRVCETAGTLKLESVSCIIWTGMIIIVIGLLSYLPSLVLGPVFEQFALPEYLCIKPQLHAKVFTIAYRLHEEALLVV